MAFQLLTTFSNDIEAHIVEGLLQSNGIECVLENEMFSRVYPIGFNSLGGIKLLVPEQDYERALKIFSHHDNG